MSRNPTPADVQAERDQATQDYFEEMQAVRERTAKLRAERLAREAAVVKKTAKKKVKA